MTHSTTANSVARVAARRLRSGWLWIFLAFVALGLLIGACAQWLVDRFPGADGIVFASLCLAAILAAVLVAFAARQGIRAWPGMRRKLTWWHGLWFLIFASTLVFRLRLTSEIRSDPLDAWAALRIVPEFVVALVLTARLVLRRPSWLRYLFRGPIGWLAIYALVCVTSTLWSVYPAWTLYKSCEYLLDVCTITVVLATVVSTDTYKTLFDWTWILDGALLASVWTGLILSPERALEPPLGRTGGFALSGIYPFLQANIVGELGAVMALVAFCRLLPIARRTPSRAWYTLLFILSVATMVTSQTRSATGGFLLGIFIVLCLSGRAKVAAWVGFATVPLLALSGLGHFFSTFMERGQSEAGLSGLTGRLSWWELAWKIVQQHPLTGVGAYAGARFGVFKELGMSVSSLHSDYMETLTGTSIWGLVPILIAVIMGWWFLLRSVRNPSFTPLERQLALEAIGVLAVLFFRSIFDVELVWHAPLAYLAILGYAEFLRRRRTSTIMIPGPGRAGTDWVVHANVPIGGEQTRDDLMREVATSWHNTYRNDHE
jgi:O-antigen ligase